MLAVVLLRSTVFPLSLFLALSPVFCVSPLIVLAFLRTFAMYIQFGNCGIVNVLVSLHFMLLLSAQSYDYPTANLSTSWSNSQSTLSTTFMDGTMIRPILLRKSFGPSFGPSFACGFFCNGTCDSYLFAIFIVLTDSFSRIDYPAVGFPQVVWTANRNKPVNFNSTLDFTSDGDLILKDADGALVWSTNTSGKSVVGLNLTDLGNLSLFDANNVTVWQSFDHPTDSLLPGQKLFAWQKLVPSVSITNWTQQRFLSLNVYDLGMVALVESNPPQVYFDFTLFGKKVSAEPTYVTLQNGSFGLFINSSDPSAPDHSIIIPEALQASSQYARFCPDGHLRLYEWGKNGVGWKEVANLIEVAGDECFYPTACGDYGICYSNGQCSCPSTVNNGTTYFKQKNYMQPVLGCSETTPLSCQTPQLHTFIKLPDATYFTFLSDLENVDLESCKEACSRNCSCKAAVFRYWDHSSNGNCYLPNQVFSFINNYQEVNHYNSTIYLKVQNVSAKVVAPQPTATRKKKHSLAVILGSSIGSFFVLLIFLRVIVFLFRKKDDYSDDGEEDYVKEVPGMLTRFSHEDLNVMTEKFSKVLGEGGFGTVFEGTRIDGTKIAVKCLKGLIQVKKSFLAEVTSIGSIHHMNLVRLLGFCAEKSHRILVYEFMPNGSLDKWIFHANKHSVLNWKQKKKIILDIAKGLTYLHEECSQKIIHMDIKPQNILLDRNYNAKICDFGLSKLIDRDQSKVVTTMRGTPGYLAPEWLSSVITEKVDIYSFGVVLLEILCGRKNIDSSQPEELMHLLRIFEKKQAENKLLDLVENYSEEMESDKEEVMNMMKIATWCLQTDYAARPSMSMVVKVLEGDCKVEDNGSGNVFCTPLNKSSSEATPLSPFVLSGPR